MCPVDDSLASAFKAENIKFKSPTTSGTYPSQQLSINVSTTPFLCFLFYLTSPHISSVFMNELVLDKYKS